MKLTILIFVCSITNPICNTNTARVYQVLVAPPGVIVCPPSVPIIQSAAGPDMDEYLKIRCVLR